MGQLNETWAQHIIKELVHQGIRYFCIAPGSRSTPLTLAAHEHPLAEHVIHFDERGLAFHGLGFAKGASKGVALIVTSGTAVGNLLPAVMEAHHSHIPLIILTADRPPELKACGANQTTDQVKIFQNFVRFQMELPCPDEHVPLNYLSTTIAEAVSLSKRAPKGPVHLNCMFRKPFFPKEILDNASKTIRPQTIIRESKMRLLPSGVAALADELSEHDKGIIILGELPRLPSYKPFFELARRLQWPIFADILSQVRAEGENFGVIPYYDLILQLKELEAPEAILHFGKAFISKSLNNFVKEAKAACYCQVLDHPYRQDPNHLVTEKVEADPLEFCKQLTSALPGKSSDNYLATCIQKSEEVRSLIPSFFEENLYLSEPYVQHSLSFLLDATWGVFISNSMPIRDADLLYFPKNKVGPIFGNRGLSGIDGNIASAIGLSKGLEKSVVAILGDLAFLHDLNSLALLKKHPHPLLFIVINNGGGGIFSFLPVHEKQEVFEELFATAHTYQFENAAKLFNLNYYTPSTPEEFMSTINQTTKEKQSAIIEVHTDREQNLKLHEELKNLRGAIV